jgi:hypothetical protein
MPRSPPPLPSKQRDRSAMPPSASTPLGILPGRTNAARPRWLRSDPSPCRGSALASRCRVGHMVQAVLALHLYEPDTPRSAELLAAIAAKFDSRKSIPARHATVPVQIERSRAYGLAEHALDEQGDQGRSVVRSSRCSRLPGQVVIRHGDRSCGNAPSRSELDTAIVTSRPMEGLSHGGWVTSWYPGCEEDQ